MVVAVLPPPERFAPTLSEARKINTMFLLQGSSSSYLSGGGLSEGTENAPVSSRRSPVSGQCPPQTSRRAPLATSAQSFSLSPHSDLAQLRPKRPRSEPLQTKNPVADPGGGGRAATTTRLCREFRPRPREKDADPKAEQRLSSRKRFSQAQGSSLLQRTERLALRQPR